MVKYGKTLRLAVTRISKLNVALSNGCVESTMQDVVKMVGVECPLLEKMDDTTIRSKIYVARDRSDISRVGIYHAWVDCETRQPVVTTTFLWLSTSTMCLAG